MIFGGDVGIATKRGARALDALVGHLQLLLGILERVLHLVDMSLGGVPAFGEAALPLIFPFAEVDLLLRGAQPRLGIMVSGAKLLDLQALLRHVRSEE